jgi:hypothetical protein
LALIVHWDIGGDELVTLNSKYRINHSSWLELRRNEAAMGLIADKNKEKNQWVLTASFEQLSANLLDGTDNPNTQRCVAYVI